MSIETEIKHLTEAIKALTAELQLHAKPTLMDVQHIEAEMPITDTYIESESPRKSEPKQEQPQTETQEPEKTVTRGELQDKCLQLVRAKPENKTKVKDLLSQYGVKIISELKDNQLAAFMANLETEF